MVSKPSVGVFICSSDNRRDILDRVLPSILKFWPNCPYPIYVGLNSPMIGVSRVQPILAKPSGWRAEVLEQIAQVPETHLIVILDDYLFQKDVDQSRLTELVSRVIEGDLPYLRLLPLCKSLKRRFFPLSGGAANGDLQIIHEKRPFYSGLQVAIWSKKHFATLLKLSGSIWEFEHQQVSGIPHYVIAENPPMIYQHLVEKGMWLPYAPPLLRMVGLPQDLGSRPMWPFWINLRLLLYRIRFFVFGYAYH